MLPPARREVERLLGYSAHRIDEAWRDYRVGSRDRPPVDDIASDAVTRLRKRVGSAPHTSRFFGATNLREMCGGLVIRTREHGRASKIVFESHGFVSVGNQPEVLLGFGQEVVGLRTLAQHRRSFEMLRGALAPDGKIYMIHCSAAADRGRLIQGISKIVGVPVYGADAVQIIGNQALEGTGYCADGNSIRRVASFPRAVLHFD